MTFKTTFLCLSIAFVCGHEFPRRTSNHSEGSQHFIFNGEVARKDEAQFMVALFCVRSFLLSLFQRHADCGGVLIDSTTILTAAHCVADGCDKYLVRIGTHNLEDKTFPDIEVDPVKNIIIHKKYPLEIHRQKEQKGVIPPNDIAIVKLPHEPIALKSHGQVRFVELPKTVGNSYKPGTEVTTYGWGFTHFGIFTAKFPSDLMKTTLKIINHLNRPLTDYLKMTQIYCSIKDSHTCAGDSGGPLILDNVLIGILSGGSGEYCKPNRVSFFTRVDHFLEWIKENRYKKMS